MENLIYCNLKEGKKYFHSILGIVTLCDKTNICVSDIWKNFHLVKLSELKPLKK